MVPSWLRVEGGGGGHLLTGRRYERIRMARHGCRDVVVNEICAHYQICATAPEVKNESYFSGKYCSP